MTFLDWFLGTTALDKRLKVLEERREQRQKEELNRTILVESIHLGSQCTCGDEPDPYCPDPLHTAVWSQNMAVGYRALQHVVTGTNCVHIGPKPTEEEPTP